MCCHICLILWVWDRWRLKILALCFLVQRFLLSFLWKIIQFYHDRGKLNLVLAPTFIKNEMGTSLFNFFRDLPIRFLSGK